MEQNDSEKFKKISLNDDLLLMQQVVGDDYELLAIDNMLRDIFSKDAFSN